ncbi:MAG: aminopeptidase N C-terminal domain-containing protein [Planctomycetota bacterium]
MRSGNKEHIAWAKTQFDQADNMTDMEAALSCLSLVGGPEYDAALKAFYDKWKKFPLVIDKWFTLQASCRLPGIVEHMGKLIQHPDHLEEPQPRAIADRRLQPPQPHRLPSEGRRRLPPARRRGHHPR